MTGEIWFFFFVLYITKYNTNYKWMTRNTILIQNIKSVWKLVQLKMQLMWLVLLLLLLLPPPHPTMVKHLLIL